MLIWMHVQEAGRPFGGTIEKCWVKVRPVKWIGEGSARTLFCFLTILNFPIRMSATCYGYLCEFYPYLSHLCRFVTHTAKILLYYIHLKDLFYFAKTQKKYFFNSTHKMQKNYALSHAQILMSLTSWATAGDNYALFCSVIFRYLETSIFYYPSLSFCALYFYLD